MSAAFLITTEKAEEPATIEFYTQMALSNCFIQLYSFMRLKLTNIQNVGQLSSTIMMNELEVLIKFSTQDMLLPEFT